MIKKCRIKKSFKKMRNKKSIIQNRVIKNYRSAITHSIGVQNHAGSNKITCLPNKTITIICIYVYRTNQKVQD